MKKNDDYVYLLALVGVIAIIFWIIDFDQKFFDGNLILSIILILFIGGAIFAAIDALNKNEERLVILHYLGIAALFGWLFYGIVLS
jgi:hypothetical protein